MAFPNTGILSDFAGGAVSPPPGFTNSIVSTEGTLQTSGAGLCQLATGSNATGWWNAGTFGPDIEVFSTITTKPGAGNPVKVFGRVTTPGSATPDGYVLKMREQTGAANDEWEITRIDNGVDTQLGASIIQETVAGDGFGMSIVGSVVTAFWRSGASGPWITLGTRTDATYTLAGVIGCGISFSTGRLDDFGGGLLVSPVREMRPRRSRGGSW